LQLAFQALLLEFSFPIGFKLEKASRRGEPMGRISLQPKLARAGLAQDGKNFASIIV
jgi:hypothetical protein